MAVLQIVRFRLNPGVDEREFRALNERFQREVVPTMTGLVRREATRTEDGEVVLVLRYADMQSAKGAGTSNPHEVAQAFIKMIDPKTRAGSLLEIISE
jgi:hypothetical protein